MALGHDSAVGSRLPNLVADYEERRYPVKKPSLVEVIKLRMVEMGLNQNRLSELLGVSPQGKASIFTAIVSRP